MKGKRLWPKVFLFAWVIIATLVIMLPAPPAQAAEAGVSLYLLGYQTSMAGFLPPPGFYLRNDFHIYEGTADLLPRIGLIDFNIRIRYILWLTNGTVVTPWKILGANYGFGILWTAVGNTFFKGQLSIARRFSAVLEEERTDFAEIVLSPVILGWHKGKFHFMVIGNVYAPPGTYSTDRNVNTSLNRWAIEPNLGVTYLDPKKGHEFSAYLGYTINFENPATNYRTGNEFHLDWFVGQHLPKGFALGLVGFFYQQVTGDSGSGATLGDFKGQALAIGPCVTFNGKIGKHPIGVNIRYYQDLTVTNRLDGNSFYATLTFGFPGPKTLQQQKAQ